LAAGEQELVLWNRTLAKAEALINTGAQGATARQLDRHAVASALSPGDVLVSMLPAEMHPLFARTALDRGAHFVSSSYVSPAMRALHRDALAGGLCLVNEVGLDPGLDHLIAHALVAAYRDWGGHRENDSLSFRSYCGGFPKTPNPFRYKFSWSPVGVLRALGTPARCILDGGAVSIDKPWQAIRDYSTWLPAGEEIFEAYPNRDSLPFIEAYGFDQDWQVHEFVRGTLRLSGWSDAWQSIFAELDHTDSGSDNQRLEALSEQLWQDHSYAPGEPDRVVLCVELESTRSGEPVWHRAGVIDATGNHRGSAMARLVSLPVALAVKSIAAGEIEPGVSVAPAQPDLVQAWFRQLTALGETVHWRDLLAAGG
jgi:saccharopine dehydrogenase (NADP+, L-glutamate forming)